MQHYVIDRTQSAHGTSHRHTTPMTVRWRAFVVFVAIASLSGAVLTPLMLRAYETQASDVYALLQRNQHNHVAQQKHEVEQLLSDSTADLLYLSHQEEVYDVLRQEVAPEQHLLHEKLMRFSENRSDYASFTLYHESGKPLLRVIHERGRSFAIPGSELEEVEPASFIDDVLDAPVDSLHLSPLALREQGEVVASPLRATLYLAHVIKDEATDTLGAFEIEIDAKELLMDIRLLHHHVTGDPLLVNGDGHYLLGEVPGMEWGFQFPQRGESTLAADDPEAWAKMGSGKEGQFETERGLYTFAWVRPEVYAMRTAGVEAESLPIGTSTENPHRIWGSVSFVPRVDLEGSVVGVRTVFVLSGVLLTAAVLLLAWLGARLYGLRYTAQHALQEANAQLSRTVQDLQRSYREISVLNEMEDFLQSCDTVEETYTVIERYAMLLFPRDSGALYRFLPQERMLEQVVRWGSNVEADLLLAEDACWAFRRDLPHVVPPDDVSLRCPHQEQTGPGGSLCLPMGAKGALIGMLHIKLLSEPAREEDDGFVRSLDETLRLAGSISEHVALTLTNMQLRDELRAQSIKDPLTELYNRRYMEETFDREWHRAQRQRLPLSVILFDVDHFKQVNDTRGHEAGDMVLAGLGRLLRDHVRQEDVPCRYGGEEFLVIMPGANLESAEERAERLRRAVEGLKITFQGQPLQITISAGVVAYPLHGQTPETLISAADAALYDAKRAGRNRVCLPSDDSASRAPAE